LVKKAIAGRKKIRNKEKMKDFITECSGFTIGYIPGKNFYFYNAGERIRTIVVS